MNAVAAFTIGIYVIDLTSVLRYFGSLSQAHIHDKFPSGGTLKSFVTVWVVSFRAFRST